MRLVAEVGVSNGRPVRPVDGRHQPVYSDLVPRDSEEPLCACHCRRGGSRTDRRVARATNITEARSWYWYRKLIC